MKKILLTQLLAATLSLSDVWAQEDPSKPDLKSSFKKPLEKETTSALPSAMLLQLRDILRQNPTVMSSEQSLQARQSQRDAAGQQLLPTPSVSIDKTDERSRLAINRETRVLRLQQPLWAGGRLQAGIDRADAQLVIGQAESLRVQEALLDQLLQTLSALQAIAHRLKALQDSDQKHRDLLKQVEHRAQLGYSPQADVALARARWLAVAADLQTARAEQRSQIARLRQLSGPSDDWVSLNNPGLYEDTTTPLTAPLNSPDDNLTVALLTSPAHLRLRGEMESLEQDIRIEQANRLPQINLRMDQTHGDVSGTERRTFLSLNATLGAGLSTQYQLKGLRAQLQAKESERDASTRDLLQTLTTLHLDITNSLNRAQLLGESSEDTVTVMESFERQYLNGRRSWQEVFNAVREWSQTRIQRVDALQSAWLSCQRLQLKRLGVKGFLNPDTNSPADFICSQRTTQ